MKAPRASTNKKADNNSNQFAISRATAITLVPNEQNVVFTGFENGNIHRLRRFNTTELQQNNQLASTIEMGYSETPLCVLQGHTAAVTGLFAPVSGDEVTSCSLDGTVKIWTSTVANPEGGASKRCTKTINVGAPIRCMLPQGGGDSFFLGTTQGNIIRVENNKVVEEYTGGHIEAITALALAESSGALLSASLDGTVVGWDMSTRNPVYAFKGHSGHVRAAAVSGDKLYTCGSDETFVCFNVPQDFTPPEGSEGNSGDQQQQNQNDYNNNDENNYNNNDEEENNENDGENDQSRQQQQQAAAASNNNNTSTISTWPNINWIIKPAAKLELPWLPTSVTIAGNYALVGTSSKHVVCVNLRTLNTKITEYTDKVEASIRTAEKKLRKIASERKKVLNRKARRAVKEFRQQNGTSGEGQNEDEEYNNDNNNNGNDDNEEEYDEEGNYIGGGNNSNNNNNGGNYGEESEEFERQQQQQAQEKCAEVDANVAGQIARYNVLRNQFFTQSAAQFQNSSVCDLVPQQREVSHKLVCKDSVLGVAAEGARIWAISGHETIPMILRPRVRAV